MKRQHGTIWAGILLIGLFAVNACSPVTVAPTNTSAPTDQPTPTPSLTPVPEVISPVATPEAVSPIATPETISPVATPEASPEEEAEAGAVAWQADGSVAEGEYRDQADFGDMRIWWAHDGEFLYLAMEGDTTGWVSVGINPQNRMQGANYLFGYVADGIDRLWDAYGTAPTGANHPPDSDLGGTDDIVTFSGAEEDGVTRFEVQIPLDSGDDYDQPLAPGNSYPIIIAIGDADDFNAYHRRYDRGELTLAP